jgi:predicted transposase YbfD/YdcC
LLGEVPDPRRAEGKLYELPYVLLFSILAVVTGGNSFRSIETFIKVHHDRLNTAFDLRWKRAPSHTAIRGILKGLDPREVERVFRQHAVGLLNATADPSRRTIAIDGKTLRRSFDNFNDRKAAQILHAFDTDAGLLLAHIDIEEKSNEIPAAQQLLGELDIARCTVTLDAMHCQKKTFEAAAQAGARAVIQLKDNQPTLLKNVEAVCATERSTSKDVTYNAARNRYEARTVDVFPATHAVADTEWEPLVTNIVRVERTVRHQNPRDGLLTITSETAHYLTNCAVSASAAGGATRNHWHVENTLHYTRDVTFQEDQSRIRHNPGVFARLRSFGYNILSRNKTATFAQGRYAAALAGLDALLKWSVS